MADGGERKCSGVDGDVDKTQISQVQGAAVSIDSGDLLAAVKRLFDWFGSFRGVVVAFSGGVDSAVVAAAAHRALSERALAVTAVSPSVSWSQREWAKRTAAEIGIRHEEISTDEVSRDEYRQNNSRRCFFCKQTLYATLAKVAEQRGWETIVSGTNHDDLGDYRPGIEAGQLAGVRAPLVELGLGKADVRKFAKEWGLSVWDQPASPCLASRVAYGVEVTAERLAMIEQAEAWFRARGFEELRVRLHEGDLARIEVPLQRLGELTAGDSARQIVSRLSEIGFRNVTLDLAGLRSGNLNQLIQIGERV